MSKVVPCNIAKLYYAKCRCFGWARTWEGLWAFSDQIKRGIRDENGNVKA